MKIIGHRGAAGIAPENSLEGFRVALEHGVAAIELDVRLTRDHQVVCFHDERLDRLTPGRGLVSEWEWSALRELPLMPGAFGGAFSDARIPLLSAALTALPSEVEVYVEIKVEPGGASDPERVEGTWEGVVAATLSDIWDAQRMARTRLISFGAHALRIALALAEANPMHGPARLGLIVGSREIGHWSECVEELAPEAIHVDHRLLTSALVAEIKGSGALANAWTVNDPDRAAELAAMGVDELTTDYPDRMKHPADRGA